jgi:hypothetical protein
MHLLVIPKRDKMHGKKKGTFIYFTRKTNNIAFRYALCLTHLARFPCVKDLGILLASRLHFHNNVDHTVAEALKMLRLIHYITSFFLSLTPTLYCVLVRSDLEIPLLPGILYRSLIILILKQLALVPVW